MDNRRVGKASAVLLETFRAFFKQSLASWLPSCNLNGGRNSLNLLIGLDEIRTYFLIKFHPHWRCYW